MKKIIANNPVIVMKFGGTSLRSEDSRLKAMQHIRKHYESGKKIVVVVSAMGRKGEPYATDTLIQLMKDVGEPVNPIELDSAISIGESLSAAYFSHFLTQNGMSSESFSGRKTGILTDNNAGNAEILEIETSRIKNSINLGKIAVVAGFQGTNAEGDIRTLGRGGSDTSAVALGSEIHAEFVEIFSDVDGIANCDPNIIPEASFLENIGVTQIMSMANEGSKVLHPRSVRASIKTKTKIIARNTFSNAKGTTICHDSDDIKMEPIILAHRLNMTLLEISHNLFTKKFFNEMVLIDKKRCLLKNDIYLEKNIKKMQSLHGPISKENGWATISVVFNKDAKKSISLPDSEIIPSSNNVICYLIKEDKLEVSLRILFDHYKLAN